jgi:tight adherence protein B
MRRALLIGACAAVALVVTSPTAFGRGARLTPAAGPAFPNRAFVLTLPLGATPTSVSTSVTEDGQPVRNLTVTPANTRFAVLLLIDASKSMRGAPIAGAMAAARALAAQRPASQSLGVVAFNETTSVLLKPTRDATAIADVLRSSPPLQSGTHIYDAVAAGMRLVDPAQFDAAAVVVLSDGNDIGSTITAAQAATAAQAGHAHLFTVGLRSGSFDPATLRDLAARGGGDFLGSATPVALAGIYKRLGDELANAYVIRYVSTAPARARVHVTAHAGPESASSTYIAPQLRIAGEVAPPTTGHHAADKAGFLGTRDGALLVAGIVLVVVLLLLSSALRYRARHVQLRARVEQYSRDAEFELATAPLHAPPIPLLERTRWGSRLANALDLARIKMSVGRFLTLASLVTLLTIVILAALTGSAGFGFVGLLAGPLATRTYVRSRIAKQRRLFADQLGTAVQAVASAMRTGHSFVGAFSQYVEHAPEPSAAEFRRLIADDQLGVPLETALNSVVDRMGNRDLRQVALVSVLQRETGGNAAEALDRVVENVRARDDLRRLMRTLTAQGRMAQLVLSALPVVTLIALKALGGAEMDALFGTGYGRALILLAALLVALGGVWIGRIVKIEV